MGKDFFQVGASAIGPVCRKKSAGHVDSLIFEIRPGELGEEGKIFLEKIDMEIAGRVVGIAEEFELLLVGEGGLIRPLFKVSEGDGLVGMIFPPKKKRLGVGSGDCCETEGIVEMKGDVAAIPFPMAFPANDPRSANAIFAKRRADPCRNSSQIFRNGEKG